VGFGPALVLSLLASGSGSTSNTVTKVTTLSLIALLADSLIMYGWQAAAAWFFSLRIHGEKLSAWGFRRPTKAFFWTIPLAYIAVYAIMFFHDLLVHPERQAILTRFPRTLPGVTMLVLIAVVAAPLFEELFFRGFLFRGLTRSWGWVLGAVISSAAFGAAHAQFTIFLPLFALGFALAWVYKRTGSLWTCIAFHALFNAHAVVIWALTG
jgi:membrane protease YdiL (CAAX protease family)